MGSRNLEPEALWILLLAGQGVLPAPPGSRIQQTACGLKGRWLPGDLRHPELRHTHLAMETLAVTILPLLVVLGSREVTGKRPKWGQEFPALCPQGYSTGILFLWPPFSEGSLCARVLTATHWLMGEEVRLSAEEWFSQSHR